MNKSCLPNMLEYIFGSKTRLKLLSLFLKNPGRNFFVRELSRKIGSQLNAVRREIDNLLKIGLIVERSDRAPSAGVKKASGEDKRKYYCLNPVGKLNQELLTLLIKDQLLTEENFINTLKESNSVDYLILSGRFVGEEAAPTDILIVGSLAAKEARRLIKLFEKETGRELRYTVMSKREFLYRRDVADKFLTTLLEGRHIVALDKIHKT